MKKVIICILCVLLLVGCQTREQPVTLNEGFVIVADAQAMEAALSLQTTLEWKGGLRLEVVPQAAGEAKTLTVAVNGALEPGQYRTRLEKGNVVIEGQSAAALVQGMRSIRTRLIADGKVKTLTQELCATLSGTVDLQNAPFYVLSQNIRYADDEGGNMVANRAPRFQLLANEYMPDILCIQEDNKLWTTILTKQLGERYASSGRFTDGMEGGAGNRQGIYFRKDRYSLVEEGTLWLSDTPTEPMTKLKGSKTNRHCNWVILKDGYTGKDLFICNVHLDTSSPEVRAQQLDILLAHLKGHMQQYPAIFVGDFNAVPEEPVYATATGFLSDPHITAGEKLSDSQITYDKYGLEENPRRLDYLFYNSLLVADTYRILTEQYGGYISDHYGVAVQYSFAP